MNGRLIGVYLVEEVPEVLSARGKVTIAYQPAHVAVCGPLAGRQDVTAEECRQMALMLVQAAEWLEAQGG